MLDDFDLVLDGVAALVFELPALLIWLLRAVLARERVVLDFDFAGELLLALVFVEGWLARRDEELRLLDELRRLVLAVGIRLSPYSRTCCV